MNEINQKKEYDTIKDIIKSIFYSIDKYISLLKELSYNILIPTKQFFQES